MSQLNEKQQKLVDKQIAQAVKAERTRVLDLVKSRAASEPDNAAYCKNGKKAVKAAFGEITKQIRAA